MTQRAVLHTCPRSRIIALKGYKGMEKSLGEIAVYLNAKLEGDPEITIRNINGIDEAEEGDLTFIANSKYRNKLEKTKASAVLVSSGISSKRKNLLIVDDPYIALARVLSLMYPATVELKNISKEAFIAESARIETGVTIYPGVYIGDNACIKKDAVIYPGVFVGPYAVIGEGTVLYPNVSVYRGCIIGNRVVLHAGVVVGSDGFGFANPGAENVKVPQVGYVQIDDECEIGANTTVDRGTLGKTWIKRGAKIDNLVQIAHNVVIGENSVIVAQVGISGSSKIGTGVLVGGQAGLVGHITVGDHAMIAAKSGIHKDVAPGDVVAGYGQMPHREWLRMQATLPKISEMRKNLLSIAKRTTELEKEIEEIHKGYKG
jgi:UDP-3-O-[3-hydroxymyristoyl] glucosamine N-acyltransferase